MLRRRTKTYHHPKPTVTTIDVRLLLLLVFLLAALTVSIFYSLVLGYLHVGILSIPQAPPHEWQLSNEQRQQQEQQQVYFFTLRDSRRLAPNQLPLDENFHIYDYVDVHSVKAREHQKVYLDGKEITTIEPPCQEYSTRCYKEKLIQVMTHALLSSGTDFFFYMEADNDLCVSPQRIADLALRYRRYFIGTGVGASGWIMSRQFLEDFLNYYPRHYLDGPDVVAALLLQVNKTWSVSRTYFVSHTLLQGKGSGSLTIDESKNNILPKHLPRCLEPYRGVWLKKRSDVRVDMFCWDYFDYDECPDADVFPCKPVDQTPIMNVDCGLKETLFDGLDGKKKKNYDQNIRIPRLNGH